MLLSRSLGFQGFPLGASKVGAAPGQSILDSGPITCSADGQFKWVVDHWERLKVGETCQAVSQTPGPTTNTPGGGVTVQGCGVRLEQGLIDVDGLQIPGTNSAPITYQFLCLTHAQVQTLLEWIGKASQDPLLQGGQSVDIKDVFPGVSGYRVSTALVGLATSDLQWPLLYFKGPDGSDRELIIEKLDRTNPANPIITFAWRDEKGVGDLLKSLLPVDALCNFLPVASKVPNPYVQVGAVVLTISGACRPDSCPAGMNYDAVNKICACGIGQSYDVVTKTCIPFVPPPPESNWLMYALLAAVGVGAIILATRSDHPKATANP